MKRRDALKLLGLSSAWPVVLDRGAEVHVDAEELQAFRSALARAQTQSTRPRVLAVGTRREVLGSELLDDVETWHQPRGIWLIGGELTIPIVRAGRLDHLELEAAILDPAGGPFRVALETTFDPRDLKLGDTVQLNAPAPGGRIVYAKVEIQDDGTREVST